MDAAQRDAEVAVCARGWRVSSETAQAEPEANLRDTGNNRVEPEQVDQRDCAADWVSHDEYAEYDRHQAAEQVRSSGSANLTWISFCGARSSRGLGRGECHTA